MATNKSEKIKNLFRDIPKEIQIDKLDIPKGLPETQVKKLVQEILSKNESCEKYSCFLGGGVYRHYIPSALPFIVNRSEFYTSYTPYQPEISQGALQALFEYQSLIAELTEMDVANSSLYDSATALGEAARMCYRITEGKKVFIIPRHIHWDKKFVLKNYIKSLNMQVIEIPYTRPAGEIDLEQLKNSITEDTAGVYIETPNFFGVFETGLKDVRSIIGKVPLIVGVNPLALPIIKPPGEYDADIAIGEGQPMGLNMNFGGPSLGIFACKKEYIRKMPGRVVSITKDSNGERAFCLTLQTREQHIRRKDATSNICTNEALLAIQSAVYIALLGRLGLEEVALTNMVKARKLAQKLSKVQGFKVPLFNGEYFNEFVIWAPVSSERLIRYLTYNHIHGGISLEVEFPDLGHSLLVSATELTTENEINHLVETLKEGKWLTEKNPPEKDKLDKPVIEVKK